MTKISDLLMIFSHGPPEYRKNAPADTKSLDFSMYMSFSIKSVQSPLECGDFYFPVLMFEEYTVNYPYYSNFKPLFPAARF